MPSYNLGKDKNDTGDQRDDANQNVYTISRVSDNGFTNVSLEDRTCIPMSYLHSGGSGSTLTTHDITYSVFERRRSPCSKRTERLILKGINAVLQPGVNAIMGPTGCGKTTLLDVLAGRKDPKQMSGLLLLDGTPPPSNFKCMMGYVVQENTLIETLTVRDNLSFSAALRFPQSVSKAERKEKVDAVISELGLQHCADSKIGNEIVRGISGGEKRRCHIGMEMIISPPVLFLDEPTTGLDANTAKSVVQLLKTLSLAGRTIVLTIHQPRYSIYRLLDNILLLSKGEVAFHGPAMECLTFFKNIGYECEQYDNPADFILDVINGENEEPSDAKSQEDVKRSVHEKIVLAYQQSEWCKRVTDKLNPILKENNTERRKRPAIKYATGPFFQFCHCTKRALFTRIRHPAAFAARVLTTVALGAIIGGIYWQTDDSCKFGLQNRTLTFPLTRPCAADYGMLLILTWFCTTIVWDGFKWTLCPAVGVFFFMLTNTVFSNVSAVELFISNRTHFLHETVSGYYRTSAYFMSAVLCDVALMRLIPTFLFSIVTYFMIGLRPTAQNYGIFLLTLFVTSIAAASIAFLISALVKSYTVANLFVSVIFMFMAVFSGLLVNLESVPPVLHWIKYISIFRYSLTLLNINELHDVTFTQNNNNATCPTGNDYLIQQGIAFNTDWDVWSNILVLLIISFGVLALAYLRLRFMSRMQ